MLIIQQLHLSYKKNQVLKGLNLTLQNGQINGIVGLNGAGKTTLLNCIYGSLTPQQGTILYQNIPLKSQQIAYLETQNFFYPRMTGKEYLHFFKTHNTDFDLEGWNAIFQLPLKKFVSSYSTGMKKKLAFLGILSLNRPILILDEPFNGLDLETNEVLKQIIQLLKKSGKMIIITSHILEALITICDKIHYLNHGIVESSFDKTQFDKLTKVFSTLKVDNLEQLVLGN